ncbi:MAG: disulfide oxidoreductase [Alphaproteobacteria bacterium]|nr:disulfide oxidoreductase [Alphaproteobacteria bacterium]MBV9904747.1 disulfide oxidoreductase [Alphaproteobacteria bacterium]
MNTHSALRKPDAAARVTAVLGPTNTGKTHFAIERMLAHRSGMIGLPLRLLAREVYDKIVRIKGANAVALITGEEKIFPKDARYYVCTVEAMPLDISVACLVIDEIQLCADPERGHVFTDRLLHARGEEETIFLGADTMRGSIQRFVPRAYFMSRARFSDLAHTGHKKLTRLPRRAAVVGFSAEDVYGIAELIRRQRGGAAVVLGALSPRTRNAQVELYQSGDVDFLVATDAIGMGLNMDVDHVAFAAMEKFDGYGMRPLRPDEVGQIAGRAGRHMNDGTFGTTGECEPLDEELIARVEGHRYDPVRVLQWRNASLDFGSLDRLITSLDEPPPMKGLAKARPASDFSALRMLAANDDVITLTNSRSAVHRLWEACQLPDFRKLSSEEHVRLVHSIFLFLMSDEGVLPDDWLARQIERLNITEGDVATLSGRLAQIRTWTYASHRSSWVKDSAHWQEVTRAVEDRLSDALHERLTQRFIDRRTSVLMKHLREDETIDLTLDDSGGVAIGGETVGKLEGFRFEPDPRAEGIHGRTLRAAAMRGLEGEFVARARRLTAAEDKDIVLSEHGKLWWDGAVVGTLSKGSAPLAPRVEVLADDRLKGELRENVQTRLDAFVQSRIATRLLPLLSLGGGVEAKVGTSDALPAQARGIAHQLLENFGSLERAQVTLPDQIGPLIRALKAFGIWFGKRSIYLPKMLRPDAASLLALLWGVWTEQQRLFTPPQAGLTSFVNDGNLPLGFLAAAGFRVIARRAIRLDMLERLEEELEKGAAAGVNAETLLPKLVSLIGSSNDELKDVLAKIGWQIVEVADTGNGVTHVWRRELPRRQKQQQHRRPPKREPKVREIKVDPNSPFAGLAALLRK